MAKKPNEPNTHINNEESKWKHKKNVVAFADEIKMKLIYSAYRLTNNNTNGCKSHKATAATTTPSTENKYVYKTTQIKQK